MDGPNANGAAPTPDWVSSVPAPLTRPIAIPRLVLEAIFLVLVALFAGLADLSTTAIAVVMAAAWALVVVAEWAAAARRARWHLEAVATPVAIGRRRQHRAVEHARRGGNRGRGARRLRVAHRRDEAAAPARRRKSRVPSPRRSILRPTILGPTSPRLPTRADAARPKPPRPDEPSEAAVDPETAEPDTAESVLAEAEGDTGSQPAIPQALEDEPEPQQKRRFGLFRRKQRADEQDPETPDPWEL